MECVTVCITLQLRWLGGWLSIHTGLVYLFLKSCVVNLYWYLMYVCMYVYIVEGWGWGVGCQGGGVGWGDICVCVHPFNPRIYIYIYIHIYIDR